MQNNITTWLDETAARFPDKVGYGDRDREWTFREIRETALRMAGRMAEAGLFRAPVAVYMDKRVEVIACMFAAAYSGNFYTPIDVGMPASRVSKILEILQPRWILTREELRDGSVALATEAAGKPEVRTFEELSLLKPEEEAGLREKALRQRERTIDTDLLYVLFTSGSTGTPKGVSICQRSVIDYIESLIETIPFTPEDVFGNQAPFYFDNSITDIYTAMKLGATMQIIPEDLFSWPALLLDYIEEKKINSLFWVPTALIHIARVKALRNRNFEGKITKVFCCGEVMPVKQLNYWRQNLPNAFYANLYGPTEITDVCTIYIVDREFSDEEALPIGRSMRNSDVFLLDEKDRLIEDASGGIGEICIRGTCLSRGYYRNPEKTRAAFVQNPLNDAYPETIYRSGDLARYNERGEIMYLSRKDFQIKHLGFRIELGEIETAVSSLPEMGLNCCLYDEKRSRIVLIAEGEYRLEDLTPRLKTLLPDYMLPGRLICLEKMPLNVNGKIDRVALKELL